jgi:hypothetical protein
MVSLSPTTSIKTKELSSFFEQFAQTLAKAMGFQGTKPKHLATCTIVMPKLRMQHKLSFAFSAEHQGILSVIVLYINPAYGKCKKDAEGKVVLLSGQYCPRSIPGQFIKD